MAPAPVWNGNQQESSDLVNAIAHHCECTFAGPFGKRATTCPPHEALTHDQRFLDGLLFARYLARRLVDTEDR